uniref:hypothetical protein n=1 Tax=uncultured Rhodospira sp. TaxID=1936189 RepID=UPI002603E456
MSRAPARRSTGDRANLYSEITDRIIADGLNKPGPAQGRTRWGRAPALGPTPARDRPWAEPRTTKTLDGSGPH